MHAIISFPAAHPSPLGVHLDCTLADQLARAGKARMKTRNLGKIERQLTMEIGALGEVISNEAARTEFGKGRRDIRFGCLQLRGEGAWRKILLPSQERAQSGCDGRSRRERAEHPTLARKPA